MVEIRERGFRGFLRRYGLLLPVLLLMLTLFLGPIVLTVFYSFTNLALTGAGAANLEFIWFDNYIQLTKDPVVVTAILNTLVFLFGSLLGQQIVGFTMAYNMKNKNKVFRSIVGPIVLALWVTPEVVAAMCMYSFFFDNGTVNQILEFINLPPVLWLFEHSMLTVILANVMRGTAFSMMTYQAALDDVPEEIEEAAQIDGANRMQRLFAIVLPCIKSTIGTNTMLNTLQTLGVFGLIFMMTGGGPGTATQTLPIFMYNQAFKGYQLGYGTAISMILLALGATLSVFYTRISKRD